MPTPKPRHDSALVKGKTHFCGVFHAWSFPTFALGCWTYINGRRLAVLSISPRARLMQHVPDSTPIATVAQRVMGPALDDTETPSSESSSGSLGDEAHGAGEATHVLRVGRRLSACAPCYLSNRRCGGRKPCTRCREAGKDTEYTEQGAEIDEQKLPGEIKKMYPWQTAESAALVAELVKQLRDRQGFVEAGKLRREARQRATRIEKKRSSREQRERIRQLELALSMHKAQSSVHRAQLQYIEATKSDLLAATLRGKAMEFEARTEHDVHPEEFPWRERAHTDSSGSTPTAELEQNDLDFDGIFDDITDNNTVDHHVEAGAGGAASSGNVLDNMASIFDDPHDFNFEEALRWMACRH